MILLLPILWLLLWAVLGLLTCALLGLSPAAALRTGGVIFICGGFGLPVAAWLVLLGSRRIRSRR
ncbi:MAG TPA: hypothetical protein VFK12_06775 [Gammaproteobacteria bacterium]|jgi:hypothetical protein|nr:hypothetical protein [Gammaproteobacteria bacterium]